MFKSRLFFTFLIAVLFLGAAILFAATAAKSAAAPDRYQVTGPVLEGNDSMIAVQKGKDRWELARDASTQVTGDLKVGAKVTVFYRMVATKIEVKK